MSLDAIRAVGAAEVVPPPASAPPPAGGGEFHAILQRRMELQGQLDGPRGEIDRVRSEIASIRDGGVVREGRLGHPGALLAPSPANLRVDTAASTVPAADPWSRLERLATGSADDPYGWRQMSREIADSIVGPGFGVLFEQQIGQESGFHPDVVFGRRVSSAGAEGIAQLMPQYYPGVDRTNPRESLIAGAQTMRQYLTAWDGDVRKALASYNAGLGRVRQSVNSHGERWEEALPAETRTYLAKIVGDANPVFMPGQVGEYAVFGGRGPGGVLTMPLDRVAGSRPLAVGWLELGGSPGSTVRAPSDGVVRQTSDGGLVLDHGNGWRSSLEGLASLLVAPGLAVRRSDPLGTLSASGLLQLGLSLDGRAVDPARYLLRTG